MKYSQLLTLFEEAGLSPEKGAELLGVSGMTLRRWRSQPADADLPKLYEAAAEEAVHKLIVDGKLSADSPAVRSVMRSSSSLSFQSTLRSLGFSSNLLKGDSGFKPDTIVRGLAEIGGDEGRKKEVEENKKKIFSFRKLSEDWKYRIESLWKVLESKDLTILDKLVAYGALFYLLTPFDLIPDYIPVVGLLDDFAILGLAIVYYAKRYPHLVKKR
jgi:uncharacterized membrane protein YkvA (DUF1232 family)